MDITPYLKLMLEKSASDLFFTVGAPVKIKIEGVVSSVGKTQLTADVVKSVAYNLMSDRQIAAFEETMESDFAISLPNGGGRFRVNVFRQRGNVAVCLRLVPLRVPTIDKLGLPEVLSDVVMHRRGLILIVGATGSGKSTTIAAMINHRNHNLSGHILTIEDPIEFNHPNVKSIVNQREVGVDTLSYDRALRAAVREAPDVILIGEIRDRETMQAALQLSNTGHLCVSTLHANNAHQALERVINLFPQDMHKQLFMDLSLNLRAIISQRLVTTVYGKRCAASEIMINTPHIGELVLNGQIDEINQAMVESGAKGMQTFDMSLYNLYKEGRITLEEALSNADSRSNLEAKINFG